MSRPIKRPQTRSQRGRPPKPVCVVCTPGVRGLCSKDPQKRGDLGPICTKAWARLDLIVERAQRPAWIPRVSTRKPPIVIPPGMPDFAAQHPRTPVPKGRAILLQLVALGVTPRMMKISAGVEIRKVLAGQNNLTVGTYSKIAEAFPAQMRDVVSPQIAMAV